MYLSGSCKMSQLTTSPVQPRQWPSVDSPGTPTRQRRLQIPFQKQRRSNSMVCTKLLLPMWQCSVNHELGGRFGAQVHHFQRRTRQPPSSTSGQGNQGRVLFVMWIRYPADRSPFCDSLALSSDQCNFSLSTNQRMQCSAL